MPNWCKNRVEIYSDNEKDLEQIRFIFESDRPFHQIIPEPDWATIPLAEEDSTKYGNKVGEIGELPVQPDPNEKRDAFSFPTFKSTGRADERWYDWRIKNWGIKWDIDSQEGTQEDNDFITYEFETPWGPPEHICETLREKFEDVTITWFFDEPGMQFAGYL